MKFVQNKILKKNINLKNQTTRRRRRGRIKKKFELLKYSAVVEKNINIKYKYIINIKIESLSRSYYLEAQRESNNFKLKQFLNYNYFVV